MEETILKKARQTLTNYLEENKCRKTPERFAILDAVYAIDGHFTLEQLGQRMEQDNFRVSKATLYNAINLFMKLRLVVRHHFQQTTMYEACFNDDYQCHQICTVCGKVMELPGNMLSDMIAATKLRRFHPLGGSMYIYGLCSTCQAKITRQRGKKRISKMNNNPKNEQRKS